MIHVVRSKLSLPASRQLLEAADFMQQLELHQFILAADSLFINRLIKVRPIRLCAVNEYTKLPAMALERFAA